MIIRPARLLPILLLLLSLVASTMPAATAAPPADATAAAATAAGWLRDQVRADGGFAGFGDASDPSATADAIVALVAAGVDPAAVTSSEDATPLAWLSTAVADIDDPGVLGKVALAFVAAGEPLPASVLDRIAQSADPQTGIYGPSFYGHLIAVLALSAAGADVPEAAVAAIPTAQAQDGSWGFTGDPAGAGDSNTTALAIMALARMDTAPDAVRAGLDYLTTLRDSAGAVGYDTTSLTGGGDANSTALAIQAVVAAGEDPASWHGGDLYAALRSFQNPSGAFQFQPSMPDDSLLATVQAIPALLGAPLPIRPTASSGPHNAGIVVRHGDGTLVYVSVSFDEDSITSEELLIRSGLESVVTPFGGLGAAVCSLDNEGCPSSDCFCKSYSSPAYFWHFYTMRDGEWVAELSGPTSRTVRDGDIDGWSWTADEPMLPNVTLPEIAELIGVRGTPATGATPGSAGSNAPSAEPTALAVVVPPDGTPVAAVPAPKSGGAGTNWVAFSGLAAGVLVAAALVLIRQRRRRTL